MLRKLVGVVAVATALFWAVVFAVAAPVVAVAWCGLWAVVLALDFQLYRSTAPDPPVVVGEVDRAPPLPPSRR